MSEKTGTQLAVVGREPGSSAMARTSVEITGLAEVFKFAAALAQCGVGVVPKAYAGNANAIAACIVTGAEMGVGAMESLRSIYLVDGKPQLSAELMMRIAIQRGVTIEWVTLDDKMAHARFRRPGYPQHEAKWTISDAERAGLAHKDVWKKYPRAMLRSRCVSEALRAWAPDVLGAGVYVEGEFDAEQAPRTVTATVVAESAPTKPRQLSQCSTADELFAWCDSPACAAARKQHGDAKLAESIRKVSSKVGVSEAEALRWAGLGPAPAPAATYDPETGEVAPDQEPAT